MRHRSRWICSLTTAVVLTAAGCTSDDQGGGPSWRTVRQVRSSLTALLEPTGETPTFRLKRGCTYGGDITVEATVDLPRSSAQEAERAVARTAKATWTARRSWPYQARTFDGELWGLTISDRDGTELTVSATHVTPECPVD